MIVGAWAPLKWLALAEHELLLFAGAFFLLGLADELAVDCVWGWLKLTGRARTLRIRRSNQSSPLAGPAAVLIPAWQEEAVIATTIAHALSVWPQRELVVYAGCYRNDPVTAEAIGRGAASDPRARLVVHDREGPTTKADCLNRLYAAMEADEERRGRRFRMVLLHDAEDMVDPASLGVLDAALARAEFVQLPVLPQPQPASRWIGSHYCEEFAEAHAKAMVVRSALGVALPAAGVGCAFSRDTLEAIAADMPHQGPFSVESLTEDYELGLKIRSAGGRSWFLRARGEDGRLVATRACFPPTLAQAVRQKARWIHGIAFQGWDRLGWSGGVIERWMRIRDRRGPFAALVLLTGYLLLALTIVLWGASLLGLGPSVEPRGLLLLVLWANLASFAWRAALRFAFTAREYGWREGMRAILRLPSANVIAILAGRRALVSYVRSLLGGRVRWEKTQHHAHPAQFDAAGIA
jgi:adsorption protein B